MRTLAQSWRVPPVPSDKGCAQNESDYSDNSDVVYISPVYRTKRGRRIASRAGARSYASGGILSSYRSRIDGEARKNSSLLQLRYCAAESIET